MTRLSLGYGTAQFQSRDVALKSVQKALKVGYRHLDTADHYQYMGALGEAIGESPVSRDQLTVATKLHSTDLDPDSIVERVAAMSQELGVEVIDLVYVHWPTDAYDPERTFMALDRLRNSGEIRKIGVCNFTPELLQEAVEASPVPIFAHQFEIHPFLPQNDLIATTRDLGIEIVAHSPLGGGRVFESEVLQTIADDNDATVAQVVLAWLINRQLVCPIPKSTGQHIEENFSASEMTFKKRTYDRIDSIESRFRVVDYTFSPWNV